MKKIELKTYQCFATHSVFKMQSTIEMSNNVKALGDELCKFYNAIAT